jgi:hypothetical protein
METRALIIGLAFGLVGCGEAQTGVTQRLPIETRAEMDSERARLCDAREDPTIPELTDCASSVRACGEDTDGCLDHLVTSTLVPFLHESCDFHCGQLLVGFRQGCITRVEGNVGVYADTPYDGLDCTRRQLLGSRWDCAPLDGELSVHLGSCTIR